MRGGPGTRRQDLQADGRRQTGEGEAKDETAAGGGKEKRYERVELTGGQSPDAEGRIRHPADHAGRVCTETECAVRAGNTGGLSLFGTDLFSLSENPCWGF